MVKVLFFAQVREKLQRDSYDLECKEALSINELIKVLVNNDDAFEYLKEPHLFVAVNQTLCSRDQTVNDLDEVAFFPAVTGG
ncbi:MoaD/ThiS family protein [Glaciecola sp. KUL10]|jgi:molybdopterin synthase sulfur carrier subunit|uniref:MoaD/ThiS family protein n=1 Tax=Glaciecola sp. (strain KUL10) TaxID=2161813 RepID=UPI000D78A334|nr:MoaD/ThiS family protein [Glaciecola sp. KUL10]GBL06170.1 molybdopterin synthase sulfur carrier subunit [Glaciecola sp. KUL10]